MFYNKRVVKKEVRMLYLYRPTPPSFLLRKTNPKEYQEQMKRYLLALSNYQVRLLERDCDMMAVRNMHLMYHNDFRGSLCPGCTLGNGLGLYM